MAKTIAKSLHTVTVLANLAVYLRAADNGPVDQGAAHYVNRAAEILGYPLMDSGAPNAAHTSDPHGLLGKASAIIAKDPR
jgi:hypothetical protein